MYCKGVVMFKGVEKREGGTFTNNGEKINYDASYVIKFDEIKEGKINERKLKFPINNKMLYEKFSKFNPYTNVLLTSEVVFGQSACRLVPVDVELYDSDEDNENN